MRFRRRPGLPPYGPLATAFPEEWGRRSHEGLVVEFEPSASEVWVGNFQPGIGGLDEVRAHPNGHDVLVVAAGDIWVVDPDTRRGEQLAPAADAAWDVSEPEGVVFSRQGLAFLRLGPSGLLWHTRRLSWDGFDRVEIRDNELTGFAWSWRPGEEWTPFRVDLRSGRSSGGSYSEQDAARDAEKWEHLNE